MLDYHYDKNALILKCQCEQIDAAIAVRAYAEIEALLESRKVDEIIFNLDNVRSIDSSGLGAFVSISKLLGEDGVLRLAGIQDNVMQILRLMRMDKMFQILEAEPETSSPQVAA